VYCLKSWFFFFPMKNTFISLPCKKSVFKSYFSGYRHSLGGRALAYQSQSPEFKPQYCKKKKKSFQWGRHDYGYTPVIPAVQKTESGGSWFLGQSELHSEILSPKIKMVAAQSSLLYCCPFPMTTLIKIAYATLYTWDVNFVTLVADILM
jgi:hypothetical protein